MSTPAEPEQNIKKRHRDSKTKKKFYGRAIRKVSRDLFKDPSLVITGAAKRATHSIVEAEAVRVIRTACDLVSCETRNPKPTLTMDVMVASIDACSGGSGEEYIKKAEAAVMSYEASCSK